MKRLSRVFSKEENIKEKEANVTTTEKSPSPPPPTYDESEQQEQDIEHQARVLDSLQNLVMDKDSEDLPDPKDCVAHLKLLECFYRLKQRVAGTDGLFDISNDMLQALGADAEDKKNELCVLLAEKRWQVYVTRAVQRFSEWIRALKPSHDHYTLTQALEYQGEVLATRLEPGRVKPLAFDAGNMPPIDILMVWHSYMLNPRAYLEDCARTGYFSLWHTPFPLEAAAQCIENANFLYEVTDKAMANFVAQTRHNWDNLEDSGEAAVHCPRCDEVNSAAWTTCGETKLKRSGYNVLKDLELHLSDGQGYADPVFHLICKKCNLYIKHDTLRAGKFLKDTRLLLENDVLMPGNILGRDGLATRVGSTFDKTGYALFAFPSRLLKAGLGQKILDLTEDDMMMDCIRSNLEIGLSDRDMIRKFKNPLFSQTRIDERLAVRRMMSRYWENSSPFAIDLVGAVIRQASFVEKMHNIDWLHSPALSHTIPRLIRKYSRFIGIISKNSKMAVPTLDVDLAWHTHQLNPSVYLQYTVAQSRTFIDHDDKVAEIKLTDAFAETSKIYQRLYGEPYSECTCWYCEAVRESHTSTASRLFRSSSNNTTDQLHDGPSDPKKSVHISAHNAVRPDGDARYDKAVTKRIFELEKAYEKACHRADKKGKPRPKRDDYYYSEAYGYPVFIPAYAPFYGPMYCTPMMYPVNPACMAMGAGPGNCCAGTCSAGAAAGSCSAAGLAACGTGGSSGAACGGVGGGGAGCGGGGGGGAGCGGGGGGGC